MMSIEPGFDNFNNYVFDTNVLNLIAVNNDMILSCRETLNLGFAYFITEVQERELKGTPDRNQKYDIDEAWHPSEYLSEVKNLISMLNIKNISCVALCLKDFSKVDGSMRFAPDNGMCYEMFTAIYNNNPRHLRDAAIAEAVIFYHCKLVTNDVRLRNKMNSFYLGSAISYNDFTSYVKAFIIEKKAIVV